MSLTTGGRHDLLVDAGAGHAGRLCAVRDWPGLPLYGHRLPLNIDAHLEATLLRPGGGIVLGAAGVLDTNGRGSTALVLPPGAPASLRGLQLHDSVIVSAPASPPVGLVSNPVGLRLVP